MITTTRELKGRIMSRKEVKEHIQMLYKLIHAEGNMVMALEDGRGNLRLLLQDCFVDLQVCDYDRTKGGAL